MLGEFVSIVSVGYYTIAQNISNMINALLLTVITVTIPRLSHYVANENEEEYMSLLNKISKMYFLLVFPASIGMFLLSREIILLYGGPEYISSIPIMMVFSLYIITVGYDTILSNQVMYIRRKEKQQVQIIFIGGLINLILNVLLLVFGIFNGTTADVYKLFVNLLIIRVIGININEINKYFILSMEKILNLILSTFLIYKFSKTIIQIFAIKVVITAVVPLNMPNTNKSTFNIKFINPPINII